MTAALMLFGCYRKGDANDPEIYAAAIAATLSDFTREVVDYAVDPRTGIASKVKFLPTVAEVREFCQAHADWCVARDRMIAKGYKLVSMRWVKPGEAA
jgi:hypothetical protein